MIRFVLVYIFYLASHAETKNVIDRDNFLSIGYARIRIENGDEAERNGSLELARNYFYDSYISRPSVTAAFRAAKVSIKLREYERALSFFEFALNLDPSNSTILFEAGLLKHFSGDFVGAIQTYNKIKEPQLLSFCDDVLFSIGVSYQNIGEVQV